MSPDDEEPMVEPYWWPTFSFEKWDADPRIDGVLTSIEDRLQVDRYDAWLLMLSFLRTSAHILSTEIPDDKEPWERDDG